MLLLIFFVLGSPTSSQASTSPSPSPFPSPSPWSSPCIDNPQNWKDASSVGDTCTLYEVNQLCAPSRGYGAGWQPEWATFGLGVQRVGATEACCAC